MSAPYFTTGTPDDSLHEVQPPPNEDETAQHVAEILIAGGTVAVIAYAIYKLLRPYGIGIDAIVSALNFTTGKGGTPHRVRAQYAAEGVHPFGVGGKVMRAGANMELYYRSSYIVNASHRIQKDINAGVPLENAISDESLNYRKHVNARNDRQRAVRRTAVAAELFGKTLGWYLNPLLNNERECIAANGHNYQADTIPVIGLPGMVHAKCGCRPGPPHEGATSVDEATRGHYITADRPKLLRLKKRAS